jgi:hypothetical protein
MVLRNYKWGTPSLGAHHNGWRKKYWVHIMTSRSGQMSILQERLLLQELNHRISNEFTSAIGVMSCAAARSNNIWRAGTFVECRVLDNGSAPINFHPGHGLKIVDELTKALDGRFDQKFGAGGSASILVFPISGEPQIPANRRIENRMLVASGYVALDLDLDQSFPIPQTAYIEQVPKTE